MKKVLIYIDPEAVEESIDLLEAADKMYGPGKSLSFGLWTGSPEPELSGALDNLVCIQDEDLSGYDAAEIAVCMEKLQAEHRFDAVLIPATSFGQMIASRAAIRLHTGLVAEVTAIRHSNDEIVMVRPAFSGRMLAGIVNSGDGPLMMSVRRNTFSRTGGRVKDTAVLFHKPGKVKGKGRRKGVRFLSSDPKPAANDIRESNILVSGGEGVSRYFGQLEELAEVLNGVVAASRKVVDRGVAPRHIQVGQSGKTVNPKLYLALGISGSIQHMVGLKNAEYIITVNPDRLAPICSLSNIVVEADARDFIPRIIERIKKGETQ